ncbi:putative E3 ubiquitin-protein ligase WAVH2 isoform X1 [Primulina tabacum]|uniref:putative E3 ubiquitin-protein ligase WAVH2 isoform X1 n=2 Tax=Primulina tabacum TaxID=48773 RepID=UPI003F5ACF52
MGSQADNKTCAICLESMESGQGQTFFTAEGALSFHFSCVSNSVTYGNYLCPVCRAKWNDLPLAVPNSNTNVDRIFAPNPVARVMHEPKLILFSDDELPPLVTADPVSSAPPADPQNISIKTIPERVAVASSESVSEFSVLVQIIAPPEEDLRNTPIDLVAVLDVSGSMHGSKLALLKRAVVFVIDRLGPSDRLSIVSFSTRAQRVLSLCRMTEDGRENAKQCVNSLLASGCTNILEALEMGVQVLEERRYKDPVGSILFFSDGMDTCYRGTHFPRPGQPPPYLHLLPASIYPENHRGMGDHDQKPPFPVYTFGFGADHDPLSLKAISDVSVGHFSIVNSYEAVEDIVGLCIGFLHYVLAQELCLIVRSASHGVQILSISSERYASSKISNKGSQALINFGDFFWEEEQDFIVNLTVPVFCSVGDAENNLITMSLLDITCSYISVVSNDMVQIDGDRVTIRRPIFPTPLETTVSLKVDEERNRVLAEQGFIEAQEMAETGDLTGARALLLNRRSTLLASASGQAGKCRWLLARMEEMGKRMESRELYERDGRPYALSIMGWRAYQKAIARGSSVHGAVESEGFLCGCAAPQGHGEQISST